MRSHLFSRRLWTKDFVLILLVCTIASYPNSILISLLPVYVLDLGGTNTWTGMMMTGLTLLGMVTNAAVAPLIDRVGRKKLLVLGNGLYALNAAMFCLTEDLTALFVLRVLCGFTQGVFFPVPPIVAADNAPEDLMVDAMGLFGAASSIAFAVTPTIGLFLYETFGPQAMFLSGAAMGTVSFVLFPVCDRALPPAPGGKGGAGAVLFPVRLGLCDHDPAALSGELRRSCCSATARCRASSPPAG